MRVHHTTSTAIALELILLELTHLLRKTTVPKSEQILHIFINLTILPYLSHNYCKLFKQSLRSRLVGSKKIMYKTIQLH